MSMERLLTELLFVVVGVAVGLLVYTMIVLYKRRPLESFGDIRMFIDGPEDGNAMRAQIHVVGYVGSCKTFFLVDTGFSGELVVNETILSAARDTGAQWDSYGHDKMFDSVGEDVPTVQTVELMKMFDIKPEGTHTRTLHALSGIESREVVEGSAELRLGTGKSQRVNLVTDFVPETGCIITMGLLVRMRPLFIDFVTNMIHTGASTPDGAWDPKQSFDGVVFLEVEVGGVDCRLIMDTGYGGCIALNRTLATQIATRRPCATLDATVTQFDVHDNQVCASVMQLPCAIKAADGSWVELGTDVPVYANESTIDGDGLIGLEVLRRFSFIAIDTTLLGTPRVSLGPPQSLNWCEAYQALQELSPPGAERCETAPLQRPRNHCSPTIIPTCS